MKKDCLDYGFDLYVAFVDGKPVECGKSRILLEKSYSLMLKRASLKRHKIEIKKCFCTILEKPKTVESSLLPFLDLDDPADEVFAASYDRYLENRANPMLDPDYLPF